MSRSSVLSRVASAGLALSLALAVLPAVSAQADRPPQPTASPTSGCAGTVVTLTYSSGYLLPDASHAAFYVHTDGLRSEVPVAVAEVTDIADFVVGSVTVPDISDGLYDVVVDSSGSPMGEFVFTVGACAPVDSPVTSKRSKVGFAPDSSVLTASAQRQLRSFAAYAREHHLTRVTVVGYTLRVDSQREAWRVTLGQRRADAVAKFLTRANHNLTVKAIGRGSINAGRVAVVAFSGAAR